MKGQIRAVQLKKNIAHIKHSAPGKKYVIYVNYVQRARLPTSRFFIAAAIMHVNRYQVRAMTKKAYRRKHH